MMKKTIWITGVFVLLGIVAVLLYFSFFTGKSSSTPEGTFVKRFDSDNIFAGGDWLEEAYKEQLLSDGEKKAGEQPFSGREKEVEQWRQSA